MTALSHRAINNLLAETERAATRVGVAFRGRAEGGRHHPAGRVPDGGQIENVADNAECLDPRFRARRRHDVAVRAR